MGKLFGTSMQAHMVNNVNALTFSMYGTHSTNLNYSGHGYSTQHKKQTQGTDPRAQLLYENWITQQLDLSNVTKVNYFVCLYSYLL